MEGKEPKRTKEEVDAEVAKTLAEAAKAEAEAQKLSYEARKMAAEAASAEAQLQLDEMELAKVQEKRKNELANDSYHHVYNFNTRVDGSSCTACRAQLTAWHRRDREEGDPEKPCAITIVFNSPGGSVIDGMALFDYIRWLSSQGHFITTICNGYAASMGGILLQAGDYRIMGKESYVLIHEIAASTGGKIGEMEDDVVFYHKICDRVIDIFVNRSGGKLTKRVMKANWTRKDWWLDSAESLKLGIVDEIS